MSNTYNRDKKLKPYFGGLSKTEHMKNVKKENKKIEYYLGGINLQGVRFFDQNT